MNLLLAMIMSWTEIDAFSYGQFLVNVYTQS